MWTCSTCGRIFEKIGQPHSCQKFPFEKHFENKEKAKKLFDVLVRKINKKIGECKMISLPCCIHLFGTYDFLAALPKKNSLEIRFALNRKLNTQAVRISTALFKNYLEINNAEDIDEELIEYIDESYHLKNK